MDEAKNPADRILTITPANDPTTVQGILAWLAHWLNLVI